MAQVYRTTSPRLDRTYNAQLTVRGYLYRIPGELPHPRKLNKRSRGQHQPGSGNYENRWVFSDEISVDSGNYPGYLFADFEWANDRPDIYLEPAPQFGYWDGYHYIRINCECRKSGSAKNTWNLICSAYWVSDDYYRGYFKSKRKSWNVFGGVYGQVRRGEVVALARGIIAEVMIYDYSTASLYGGTNANFNASIVDGVIDYPEPKFDPSMNDFRERWDIGDPTLHLSGKIAAAYCNAVDNLPTARGMDNVANALDLLSALKSTLLFLIGGGKVSTVIDVGEFLKSAWLSYRYVYSTTKSDCEEALNIASRIADLLRTSTITSNGTYREGNWCFRCSIAIESEVLTALHEEALRWSMSLNAYNMWDLIPYSFVVDWFLRVGDLLDTYDKRNVAFRLRPSDCWFSVEREWENTYGFREIYYYRFWDLRPDLSWVSRGSYSPRVATWVKRGLDAIALFG